MLRGLVLSLVVGIVGTALVPAGAQTLPSRELVPTAVVTIQGEIDDFARDSFVRRFNQAQANGARCIIVQIDTYGGLVTA
ncbi:MAG: hypothetical protein ACREJC_16300, partial [Tepidisphaeraceae bacterium]